MDLGYNKEPGNKAAESLASHKIISLLKDLLRKGQTLFFLEQWRVTLPKCREKRQGQMKLGKCWVLHVPDTELDAFISHLTQQNPPTRNPRLGAIRALPTHSR